ncbi:serine protease inhibitor swm-1-like [Anoplolepis gracilipes]|uniref:serine protease inhibitor swm-1-like n=1 Tax=Anoplolepis gracilipes TaxID=354296 RepID=UPI003BA0587A
MARAVILLFLIAIATINALHFCGPNEVYNECGSRCPASCENPIPRVCVAICHPGCECIEGHVRNAANLCIPLHTRKTGKVSSVQKSSCSSANEYQIASRDKNMARAVILLFLIAIATINASPSCGQNEVYSKCKGLCYTSCNEPNIVTCPEACIPGCKCIEGHVRNAANLCVPLHSC